MGWKEEAEAEREAVCLLSLRAATLQMVTAPGTVKKTDKNITRKLVYNWPGLSWFFMSVS